jgi:hypothetical protein
VVRMIISAVCGRDIVQDILIKIIPNIASELSKIGYDQVSQVKYLRSLVIGINQQIE